MKQQPYKGVFEKMEFPEYKYQEYPKMLMGKDGKPLIGDDGKELIVNSIHEELRVTSEKVVAPTPAKAESEIASLKAELAAKEAQLAALQEEKAPPPKASPKVPADKTSPGTLI
jgi:hypothetical protein